MFGTGNLEAIIEIEDGVKYGVAIGDVDDGAFGEDLFHRLFEEGLLFRSVKIVCHEEAAPEKIIAKLLRLIVGQAPFAHLNSIEPGPVVDLVAIIETDGLLDRPGVDSREATDGSGEGAVGDGIVLRPQRKTFPPVALE